jgi:hypothetical protein
MSELTPQARPKRFPGLVPWLLVLLTLLAVVGAWFAFHPAFRGGQSGAQLQDLALHNAGGARASPLFHQLFAETLAYKERIGEERYHDHSR